MKNPPAGGSVPGSRCSYGSCSIEAPCKINLHLKIGEKRSDGFHSIEGLFSTLALVDTLHFERTGKNGACNLALSWETAPETILPGKNLVTRAVSLFRERTGFGPGLRIRLVKRVPPGAGLGGGSSDAASTLVALNFLSGTALPKEELAGMAVVLGSDVPFFLTGGTAFVSGRGEIAEPVKSPADLWVVLAKPPFFSDTASAFRLLDRARERGIKTEAGDDLPREGLIRALEGEPGSWPFRNDFLPVFLDPAGSGDTGSLFMERAGIYRALLETLRNAGASFTGLSGSGSACFGIFTVKEKAQTAEKTLFGKGNFTKLTFFLALRPDPVLE